MLGYFFTFNSKQFQKYNFLNNILPVGIYIILCKLKRPMSINLVLLVSAVSMKHLRSSETLAHATMWHPQWLSDTDGLVNVNVLYSIVGVMYSTCFVPTGSPSKITAVAFMF